MSDWRDEFKPDFQEGWGHQVNVGDGWKDLLRKLRHDLGKTGVSYKVCQIKEKFGGLRFYVDRIGDSSEKQQNDFDALISRAEDDSFSICENCGEPGTPGGGGWIRTQCNACRAKK